MISFKVKPRKANSGSLCIPCMLNTSVIVKMLVCINVIYAFNLCLYFDGAMMMNCELQRVIIAYLVTI